MRRFAPALLLPLLFAAACGGGASVPKDLPPASEFPAAGEAPKIVIKAAGESPRALSITPTAGTTDKVVAVLDMDISGGGGGQSIKMGFDMTLGGTQTITEVKADGNFLQKFELTDPKVKVRGDLAAQLGENGESMMANMLKGMAMVFEFDNHGRVLSMTNEGGNAAMMGQMQAGLDQALQGGAVPLPKDPIGKGAEWQSLATVDMMGAKMRMATSYKLLELDGDKGRLEISMSGGAEGQKMQMPGSPVEVDLKAMSLTAKGTIGFDLKRPTAGSADIEMKVDMDIKAAGESGNMSMTVKASSKPQ